MGIKVSDLEEMIEKSRVKKDGVYSQSPWFYGVRNGNLKIIGHKHSKEMFAFSMGFTVGLSPAEHIWTVRNEVAQRSRETA